MNRMEPRPIENPPCRRDRGRLPVLDGGSDPQRHKVLIAGGGPVGLAAALALARRGVPSLVVEADETVCQGSRAICLSRRSLEILDRLGVLEAFLARGLAWTGGRSFYRDTEVLHFLMPHDADQRLPPMINLAQFDIEQFLLDGLEPYADLVSIRWGTRLAQVRPADEGVAVVLEAAGGRCEAQADWLLACDGARSQVREALGLRMAGTRYEGRYVIADIEAQLERPTERLAWFNPPANPGRTVLMHRQPGNIWRIDYQLHPDEDAEQAVRPENVLPVIRAQLAMLGYEGPWRAIWISMYRATAVSLDRYRHGRVLFAGDAAHLVPIFGVRGLNSGLEDAWNLAWKLQRAVAAEARRAPCGEGGARDACSEGGAGNAGSQDAVVERLLDSYSEERRHAWLQNIAQATKSTEFMAPPSRGFELMRDAVLSLANAQPALRSLINPRQASSIPYPGSPLNSADEEAGAFERPGAEACANDDNAPAASATSRVAGAPGETLAECPLHLPTGEPVYLTQLPGSGFTLIVFCGAMGIDLSVAQGLARIAERAPECERVIIEAAQREGSSPGTDAGRGRAAAIYALDFQGRFAALYNARAGSAWLLRPDGHLCARWRLLDADLVLAALERAGGCLPAAVIVEQAERARLA